MLSSRRALGAVGWTHCMCSVAALCTPRSLSTNAAAAVAAANARAAAQLEQRRRHASTAARPAAAVGAGTATSAAAVAAIVAEANEQAAAKLQLLKERRGGGAAAAESESGALAATTSAAVAAQGESLMVLDCHSIAYRMFYGMKYTELSTSMGAPTAALYGFCTHLLKLRSLFPEHRLLATFDSRAPTFRSDVLPEYKANRPAMPEDLRGQMAGIREACGAFGVPQTAVDGYEADDLIAAATKLACARGAAEVVIVTTDKDLCQLVTDGSDGTTKVSVYNDRAKALWDTAVVEKKFGVRPDQLADYLALTGDASDNVPGVVGVGPKRASTLLKQHGTIEALLEAAPRMKKSKMKDAILGAQDTLRRSKELVVLGECPELEERADELAGAVPPPPAELPELRSFLARYEFKGIESRLFRGRKK